MPIWAWYQWEGSRRKPDLRASGYLPKGEPGVRLELRVADDRVLLSDFDLWHYVLNYWYLPKSEKAGEALRTNWPILAFRSTSVTTNTRCPTPNTAERLRKVGSGYSTSPGRIGGTT